MKKLFTLLILLLCAVTSSWAQSVQKGTYTTRTISADEKTSTWAFDVVTGSAVNGSTDGITDNEMVLISNSTNGNIKFQTSKYLTCKGQSSVYIPVPAGSAGKVSQVVNSSSDSRYFQLYINGVSGTAAQRLWSKEGSGDNRGPQSFDFTSSDITTYNEETYLHFKDNDAEMKITSFTVVLTTGSYGNESVVSNPVFTPVSGSTFTSSLSVEIACATENSSIYYTTDGSTPSKTNGTKYTAAINLTATTTIKAIAYDETNTLPESKVATAKFTKVISTPLNNWDFTAALSANDIDNLNADTEGWLPPSTGTSNRYFNKVALSGSTNLIANGEELELTKGLKFGNNIGAENVRIMPEGYIQLNGSNYYVIVPDLLVGDVVTVSFKGAGTDGRTLNADNAELTSGTDSNKSSQTTVSPTWRVTTAGPVKFTQSKGLQIYSISVARNAEVIPVQSFGWATYITDKSVEFEENSAYVVTDVDAATGAITTAAISSAPAGVPVLLKNTGDKIVSPIATTPSAPATNLLSVSDGTANGEKIPYVLAKNGESAGFKKWTGDTEKLNGRAVLWLDSAIAAARDFLSLDGDATSIKAVEAKSVESQQFFNLAGQRVAQPAKGLYIVNGKKVIIK